jgi:hypothetical protein
MGVKALVALAVVCMIMACGCLVEAWGSTAGNRHLVPASVTTIPTVSVVQTVTTRPKTTNPAPLAISVAPPVMVSVPAVGLSARVVPVGLNGEGQMEVPAPSVAGWYRVGPAPGAVGPAVIVGHVDNYRGPAVFYRLTAVRAGEEVDIVRADGSRSRFVISGVTVVNKSIFPTEAVFAPTPKATIRLITCTGSFDLRSRHYVDSLIVWGVATT